MKPYVDSHAAGMYDGAGRLLFGASYEMEPAVADTTDGPSCGISGSGIPVSSGAPSSKTAGTETLVKVFTQVAAHIHGGGLEPPACSGVG